MTINPDAEKKSIRRHFDAGATQYEKAAVLQREVCHDMVQRLDVVTLQPKVILDAGCGTGRGVQALMKRYRDAQVIALDVSPAMLQQTRKKSGWWRKPLLLCADAEALPLADSSVDLVFSSLMLQWCDVEKIFAEFHRVLRPNGLLMFSTFGPDTLKELRQCWAQIDNREHVNRFIDMHILGDMLLHSGFASPVMDMDMMSLTYNQALDVMRDLKTIGANTLRQRQFKGLTTRSSLQKVCNAYEQFRRDGALPASFEIVNGHAWKTQRPDSKNTREVSVPLAQIGRMKIK
jgi:malonyl-CoA O-methyltransferase